jgi:ribosomal protein L7/L12
MSKTLLSVLVLAVAVAALALVTRRPRAADPLGARREQRKGSGLRVLYRLARAGDAVERAAAELRAGNKIEAVKIVREAAGLELAEAQEAVDLLEEQLASGGPLAKLLTPSEPRGETDS